MSARARAASPGSTLSRDLGLVAWQVRYEQRAFWRNRGRGLFTFAFPIMFLVIFASLYKGQHIHERGGISYNDFFVPGILAFGIISTTYVNMAISTAILRDEGVLKRMQGTPLPRWAYAAARILSVVGTVVAMAALVLGLGAAFWGVHIPSSTLPAFVVAIILGTAAFAALGIGVVRFLPNAEAAPAIINLTVLPVTFISGVWFVTDGMPKWLLDIAKVFPVRALADQLQHAFDPRTAGAGFVAADLRVLAIWGAVGAWLMVRFMRQPGREPR